MRFSPGFRVRSFGEVRLEVRNAGGFGVFVRERRWEGREERL